MDLESLVSWLADRTQYADVRFEAATEERVHLKDREVEQVRLATSEAVFLRAIVDGAWGVASTDDTSSPGLKAAAERAVEIASRSPVKDAKLAEVAPAQARMRAACKQHPRDVDVDSKLAFLLELDGVLRGDAVEHVEASGGFRHVDKHILTTEGTDVQFAQVRTTINAQFTAQADGERLSRGVRIGATAGWETTSTIFEKAEEARASTLAMLTAPRAPGGRMPVVVDHELAGVFAHEAVGHAAEADLVAAGESCFEGKLGQKIGIDGLTIHDDPTLPEAFGSFPFDDEGVAATDRVLVRDGVLHGYLSDREQAARLDVPATGAARAEDAHSRPLVRMANTLIAPGEHAEDEVFERIKEGVFCKGSRGGQVDTARGTYLFHAVEAYRIVDGELAGPLRDVSLNGEVLGTLHRIEAMSKTTALGDPGHCGKGQWVPVCDGGPLVRIADCLVGGAA